MEDVGPSPGLCRHRFLSLPLALLLPPGPQVQRRGLGRKFLACRLNALGSTQSSANPTGERFGNRPAAVENGTLRNWLCVCECAGFILLVFSGAPRDLHRSTRTDAQQYGPLSPSATTTLGSKRHKRMKRTKDVLHGEARFIYRYPYDPEASPFREITLPPNLAPAVRVDSTKSNCANICV